VEEGPHGVRSNVIAPGPIAGTEGDERLSPRDPARQNEWSTPIGRKGDTKDIANATVFLLSDAASFISGQILVVDGAFEHIRAPMLPYPESVLDPASTKHLIKARM
jgi:peroxisomal 2,4-dienoyl-CoA reductase